MAGLYAGMGASHGIRRRMPPRMTNVGELIARVRLRARLNRLPCLRPLMCVAS